jgi:hypothetical protein
MYRRKVHFTNSRTSKVFLYLSLAGFTFFLLTQFVNFYQVAFVGAVFEFLWLPMLAAIFVIPVLSFIFWRQENYNLRSLHIIPILILFASIILIYFKPYR